MGRASQYAPSRERILKAIQDAGQMHSKAPTVRDLAEDLDVGVATAHSYLVKLSEEGMIEWKTGRHRTLKLTAAGRQELLL